MSHGCAQPAPSVRCRPFEKRLVGPEPGTVYLASMSAHGEGSGELDLREKGAPKDGEPQFLDTRMFMQLQVLRIGGASRDHGLRLGRTISDEGAGVVIYEDVSDPFSFGILTFSENPAVFVDSVRPAILEATRREQEQGHVQFRDDMTMFGRAYSSGFEPDLKYWMLERPVQTALNEEWPWAVWYPLRRGGEFEKLEPREKGGILREHAEIGKKYGAADLAHDIRLACHGLDKNDNEFVIGLIGKELYPLSHVIQRMRSTRQTSQYIVQMGPFFVGRAIYRSAGRNDG